ncbi:sensor domain-containing diguanylate cyclase [Flocculibacter collagenilyticus]|uniref:sensor domain-containing diguanylate cyclase n=1 Tax=Flocculibacter collagenilyticus TaxID=2744479 RepID=UPI0018F73E4C|nr:sensor domain-containing diguanylate cyclase [Flocculibacter collagenilyticus]
MPNAQIEVSEIHWLMEMFQTVDVGLVVIDQEYKIQVWNGFMENHSGLRPSQVREDDIFELFTELDEEWFRHKSEPVFKLKNRAFTIWEQRPYIFKFKNYRPITGSAEYMYQNATFIPLSDVTGVVQHICIIIYDVTDVAVNKLELEKANTLLGEQSRTDRLTNLNNRGHWEECLKREFKRLRRRGSKGSSLLMFDIDHFKKVNDGYGHSAGDAAIIHCANVLRANLRETDVAGRYGGEEYAVILTDTNAEDAKIFAERIRKAIEESVVKYEENEIRFTISLGIAEYSDSLANHTKWIEASDEALYQSKEGGRNQVSVYQHANE